jgi:hypothetical protein
MVMRTVWWRILVPLSVGTSLTLGTACSNSGNANPGTAGGGSSGTAASSANPGSGTGGVGSSSSEGPPGSASCTGPCCTPPAVDSACPSTEEGMVCGGGNICPGRLNFAWQVSCRGGSWQPVGEQCPSLDGGVTAEGCPAQQPTPGTSCSLPDAEPVVMGVPVCPPGGPPAPLPGAAPEDAGVLCAILSTPSCQYTLVCAPTTCEAGPAPPPPDGGDTCLDAQGVGCSASGVVSVGCATLTSETAFATCDNGRWNTLPLPASCP